MTFREFERERLKNAKIFGMTMEEYYYEDPQYFFICMEAYEFEQIKMDACNYNLAEYFLLALQQTMSSSFSKTSKNIFPERPFLSQKEESVEEKIQKIKNMLHNKI